MGFTKHTQVKAGSRAEYVKSIIDQLQEADGDIVLWQQELCAQAQIPVPAVYTPVMTTLEYLGLVDRYTGDEDEGLGKSNTGYAWVQDTVELKDISNRRERRPGQTKADFEDEEEAPSRRKKTTGKVTAKRSRVIEPEEEEDEVEEEEVPRRSRRSSNSRSRSLHVEEVEPDEEDIEEEEEEETPRSRRSSRTSNSASSRSTNRRSSRSPSVDEEDEEDEEDEVEAPKSRRRPLRSQPVVEEPEEEPKPRARPRRRAAA